KGDVSLVITYPNGPDVGSVMLRSSAGTAIAKVTDHDIIVDSAITIDPRTGKASVISKGYYVQREVLPGLRPTGISAGAWLNKPYPLSVTAGALDYTPGALGGSLTNKLMWAMHLNAGTFAGATSLGGFGYGGH